MSLPTPSLQTKTHQDWWSTHVQHFTSYRAMEVDKLAPFIETKARPGDVLSEKHHQSLFGVLQIVNAAVTDCAYDENSSNKLTASAIASTVHGYRTVLYAHLAETEKVIVPVLRSYFSPEEVFSIFADILSQMPKLAFGSLAHHLTGGDDGVTAFNARSLVTPRWWFTSSDTIKARAEYRVKVESKLESLLSGDGNIKMKNKTDFVFLNQLKPVELNERLVTTPSSSVDLAKVITEELTSNTQGVLGVAELRR